MWGKLKPRVQLNFQGLIDIFSCCCREITAELAKLTHTLEKLHNKMAGKRDEVHVVPTEIGVLCLILYVNVKYMYVL